MDQQIQQALVDAMFAIAQNGDNSLQFDRTIECTIQKIENISTGEYKVRYLDGEFSAFDLTLAGNYKVGKSVYVSIPNNDISQKKIILGLKSTKAQDLIEIILNYERVNKVGLPLEEIYKDIVTEKGIYGSSRLNKSYGVSLFSRSDDIDIQDEIFQAYAKDQNMFMISAEFKTSWLKGLIEQGNYGLEFTFNTLDGNDQKYILDFTNMIGNPLSYLDYTPVYALFKTDGNQLKDLQQIIFFSENFKRNLVEETDEELETYLNNIWQYGQGQSEIFVKNLSFSFVKEIEEKGYTLNIQAPQGIFYNENNDLTLFSELKYNGRTQEVDISKANIYWFLKDSRVSIGHEDYNEIAGIGWKEIKNENKQILSIGSFFRDNTFLVSQDFKCVVFYEDFRLTSEIKIHRYYNDVSHFNLKFTKNVDGTAYLKAETNSTNLPDNLHYHWLSEDTNGLIETISDTDDTILINLTNIIGSKTYYCTICGGQHQYPVITLSRVIKNEIRDGGLEANFIIDNGGVFTYNTYGDLYPPQLGSPQITAYNIAFNLSWHNLEPENYEYEWIMPTNSMIDSWDNDLKGSSVTGGDQNLNFSISNRYDATKAANSKIKLKITLYQDEYLFEYALGFIKEGDPGTNGTSLVMTVEPEGPAVTVRANSSIQLHPNLWFNGKRYHSIVDENGVKKLVDINSLFNFEVTIPREYQDLNPLYTKKGSATRATLALDKETKLITISGLASFTIYIDSQLYYNSIIQIKATPTKDGEAAGFLYPISLLYGVSVSNEMVSSSDTHLFKISGTKHVIYDSSGYNPQYSKIPFTSDKSAVFVVEGSIFELNEENIIEPPDCYLDEITRGAVATTVRPGSGGSKDVIIVQPIIFMANAFSKSILNSWDGSSVDVNGEKGYVLAPQIGAGLKEEDNTFTGILMGAYVEPDSSSDKVHGLYGFQKGITSFGLVADGTAFIGKPGAGRLLFDGEKSTITSNRYAKSKKEDGKELSGGMLLDFDDGKIEMYHPQKGTSTQVEDKLTGTITIDAGSTNYPFKIGDNFRVKWDGSIWAQNGTFKGEVTADKGTFNGTINAKDGTLGDLTITGTLEGGEISGTKITVTEGNIGGWKIGSTTLTSTNTTGTKIILNSATGTISGGILSGAKVETSTLSSTSGTVILDGYLAVNGISGSIGKTTTGLPNQSGTGIGMMIGEYGVKVTSSNVGMSYNKSYVTCQGDTISIGFSGKTGQVWFNSCDTYGLYARFK